MLQDDLSKWLNSELSKLKIDGPLRAYVFSVFNSFRIGGEKDLSNQSIVLLYSSAVFTGSFEKFQTIGDWSLWYLSFMSPLQNNASIIEELGVRSFDACDRLMKGQWPVFKQLSRELVSLTSSLRITLKNQDVCI